MANGHSTGVLERVGQRVSIIAGSFSLLKKALLIIFCMTLLVWGLVIPLYPQEVVAFVRNLLGIGG